MPHWNFVFLAAVVVVAAVIAGVASRDGSFLSSSSVGVGGGDTSDVEVGPSSDLLPWLRAVPGASVGAIDVGATSLRFGIVSHAAFRAGDVLMTLPPEAILGGVYAKAQLSELLGQNRTQSTDETVLLGLQLLRERRLGRASRFYAYVSTLPLSGKDLLTALFLSDDDLDCVGKSSRLELKDLRLFSGMMEVIAKEFGDYFAARGANITRLCDWSLSILVSRGFHLPQGKSLLPFMDMMNHGRQTISVNVTDGTVVISAKENVAAGVEFHTEYFEDPPLERTLSTYGFTDEEFKFVSAGGLKFAKGSVATQLSACTDASSLKVHKVSGEAERQLWQCLVLEALGKDTKAADAFLQDTLDAT